MATKRALHFVFKIGDRTLATKFFRDVLGMKVLRHEEFEEGCKASCNGPYDGKWSKTMIGYGPEDNHFVIELTYNYGIGNYKLGNDFLGISVNSPTAIENCHKHSWAVQKKDDHFETDSPGGQKFFLFDKSTENDPVFKVALASSNLSKSIDFWNKLLGMKIYSQNDKTALLGFADNQCKLEIRDIGTEVNHEKAFGRIAFSCPAAKLPGIEAKVKENGQTILTPLLSLDTPGKATVQVVILADPDGHEICFVGDEAFRELSAVDVNADELLNKAIEADKSSEWFSKKGLKKAEM